MADAVTDAAANLQLADAQAAPPADNGAKLQLDEETGEWVTFFPLTSHRATSLTFKGSRYPKAN
jgi:hypothetical protein